MKNLKKSNLKLVKEYQETKDQKILDTLIRINQGLLHTIAKSYSGYGLPHEDLSQEATIGAIQAINRYDDSKETCLSTVISLWARSAIDQYIRTNTNLIRLATTDNYRKLFYKLNSAKKIGQSFNNDELKTIADNCKVPINDVQDMEIRMHSTIEYIDDPESTTELDNSGFMTNFEQCDYLSHIIKVLPELGISDRDRELFIDKWFNELPPADIREKYTISKNRISQINKRVINKLQQELA